MGFKGKSIKDYYKNIIQTVPLTIQSITDLIIGIISCNLELDTEASHLQELFQRIKNIGIIEKPQNLLFDNKIYKYDSKSNKLLVLGYFNMKPGYECYYSQYQALLAEKDKNFNQSDVVKYSKFESQKPIEKEVFEKYMESKGLEFQTNFEIDNISFEYYIPEKELFIQTYDNRRVSFDKNYNGY